MNFIKSLKSELNNIENFIMINAKEEAKNSWFGGIKKAIGWFS